MNRDPTQKLFEYVALLEHTNKQLVEGLKKCVVLLTHFRSSVPDPKGWQEMLNVFQKTLKVEDRVLRYNAGASSRLILVSPVFHRTIGKYGVYLNRNSLILCRY